MLLLMLRRATLRKGASKFELEMRNACHLPPCSGSLLKETPTLSPPHLLHQPSKAGRRPHDTSLQVKPWGQDGHHLRRASLFPWFVVTPCSVSPGCLGRQIRPVGSSGWTMCKCSKERLFEEPMRRHMRVRHRKGEESRNEKQAACGST